MYVYMYTYIYIYICVYVCMHDYIHVYIYVDAYSATNILPSLGPFTKLGFDLQFSWLGSVRMICLQSPWKLPHGAGMVLVA